MTMTCRRAAFFAIALLLPSCSAAPAVDEALQAIVGGTQDDTSKAVVGLGVGIDGVFFFGHCTGTLIAPNLVLTARHCVAMTSGPAGNGGVVCGQTPFTLHGPGSIFRATVETVRPTADGPAFYRGTGSVFVDQQANDICGYDIALVLLAGKGIPQSVAAPIEPRIGTPAATGETFSAVGYGLTQPEGTTSGTRMRIDGRKVVCVKSGCTSMVKATEFGADAPTCQGDSGGPALDDTGRVFGVLSRGPQGCGSSIYGDVASSRPLVIEAVQAAAKQGGYSLPAWAKPYVAADLGPGEARSDGGGARDARDAIAEPEASGSTAPSSGGCTMAGEPALGLAPLLALAFPALLLLLRRGWWCAR